MPYTIEEKKKIAEIIQTAINNSEFKDFKIDHKDIDSDNNFMTGLINSSQEKNPISKIFNTVSKNRITDKGQFYHFKSFDIALLIIKNQSIQVSNLISNQENDFAEYSEFFKRIGLYHKLLPENYCKQLENKNFDPASISKIDIERENTFIICFTKDGHNENFWKKYAKNDTGVCLVFRLKNIKQEKKEAFDFRDVCYDNGYRFDFINHINYHLRNEFNKILFVPGIDKFSKFYKRGKYSWENEARLCFDYSKDVGGYGNLLEKEFEVKKDINSNRKYIEIPLSGNDIKNNLFELTIDEVICGQKVNDNNYDEIKSVLKRNFPNANIWRRS